MFFGGSQVCSNSMILYCDMFMSHDKIAKLIKRRKENKVTATVFDSVISFFKYVFSSQIHLYQSHNCFQKKCVFFSFLSGGICSLTSHYCGRLPQ